MTMMMMMMMMMMMIVCNRGGAGGEGRRQQQEPLAALGTPRVLSFVFLHGFMIRLGKRIIQVKDCERKCIFDLIKKDSWHAPSLYSLSFLSPLYPSSSHWIGASKALLLYEQKLQNVFSPSNWNFLTRKSYRWFIWLKRIIETEIMSVGKFVQLWFNFLPHLWFWDDFAYFSVCIVVGFSEQRQNSSIYQRVTGLNASHQTQ